jgi:hypothetical protein
MFAGQEIYDSACFIELTQLRNKECAALGEMLEMKAWETYREQNINRKEF